MTGRALLVLLAAAALPTAYGAVQAQAPASPPARTAFPLTVDSIMRGDLLVGHPPNGLRFSGDSKDLYFEWRDRDEDEDATYVVSRAGGAPRRLTEEERRKAPAAQGRWDRAGRRLLFQDQGDVVVVDTVARTRRQVTHTTGGEANPRWTRQDTHVTFTRDNGLFVAALAGEGDTLVQVLEAAPPKAEPRLTESQRFLRDEERALLDAVRDAGNRWVFTDRGEPWAGVRFVAFSGSPQPTHYVDTTGFLDEGIESLLCHRVYLEHLGSGSPNEWLRKAAESVGKDVGVEHAATFEVIG